MSSWGYWGIIQHMKKTAIPAIYSFSVPETAAGLRLDQAVALCVPGISRERAKKMIGIGAVWMNGRRVKIVSNAVHAGDRVSVYFSKNGCRRFYEIDPPRILYEDDWLLFYCKEPGIPCQGVPSDDYNNVAAAVFRYRHKCTPNAYVGIHHRLDIDTSGVMLFTLSPKANGNIHQQFKEHRITKTYLALVHGNPDFHDSEISSWIIRQGGRYFCRPVGPGKTAVSVFTKLVDFDGYSLVRVRPLTGRTHQIRLQLASLGHPVLGDVLYGGGDPRCTRTMLHAESLEIIHPQTKKTLRVEAALCEDMKRIIG